jgi:hypothetical protein
MEEEKDWHEGHEEQFGYDHYNDEDEYEQKHVKEHPYCTNWPVNKKKGEDENV